MPGTGLTDEEVAARLFKEVSTTVDYEIPPSPGVTGHPAKEKGRANRNSGLSRK